MDYATSATDLCLGGKRGIFRDDFGDFWQVITYFFFGSIGYAMGSFLYSALFSVVRSIISGANCRL